MSSSPKKDSHSIWGGRFTKKPHGLMEEINSSILVDCQLAMEDITASIAHCRMLGAQKIISTDDAATIEAGLKDIRLEIEQGQFSWDHALEDVHMNIEASLAKRIGDIAGRLHTARSRNDQVATDFRMWVRKNSHETVRNLHALQKVLWSHGDKNGALILPGMTHLQNAQAITLGHHFLCYIEMFGRDSLRFKDNLNRLDECPLGAAALAGTPYPIDRTMTARALDFAAPMANALDAVSDRDFALDFLSSAAITAVHLSRLAEEIVLWNSAAFSFIRLDDSWTTGSSIMPQKRNPDAAELIRGKAGAIFANFQSLLVTLKALPLAYSKDMQEDKSPVFQTFYNLQLCLKAMTAMMETITFNAAAMKKAASEGYTTATDAADWLVMTKNIPFRDAHHIVGRMVKIAEEQGKKLHELTAKQLKDIHPLLDDKILPSLSIENSIQSKMSEGGTAPQRVAEALLRARKKWQL